LKFQVLGLGCGFGERAWGFEIQFFFGVYIFGCRVSGFGFRNLVLGRFRANRFVVGVGVVLADNSLDQRHVAPPRLEEIHQHCVCRGRVSKFVTWQSLCALSADESDGSLCLQRDRQHCTSLSARLGNVRAHFLQSVWETVYRGTSLIKNSPPL